MTRDLTQGPVWKSLMLFYLPMFVTSALQQIYSTVDAIIVGQFVGKSGLAAIDAVSEFGRIPVNFAIGLAAGAAILIAQDFGAKRFGKLADTAKSAFVLSLFIGLIFSITGFLAAPWVARVMDVPADILDGSLIYLRIYFAGMVFNLLYNMGAGIMRAFGNSRTPMFVLAISGGLNVLLDLLFVGPLQMGIAGAALATVISQVVSCVLVIFLLYHCKDDSLPDLRSGCFSMVIIRKVITTGLPTAIRSALWPVANTIIHSAINGLGTDVIAAWSVNNKLTTLMWLAIDSLGPSVMTFVGQNFGAGDLKRARKGTRSGMITGIVMMVLFSVILFFLSEKIAPLFINQNSYDILPIVGEIARFQAPFYAVYAVGCILTSSTSGYGDTLGPMLIIMLGTCGFRIAWILLYVPSHPGMYSIMLAYILAYFTMSVPALIYYFARTLPRARRLLAEQE